MYRRKGLIGEWPWQHVFWLEVFSKFYTPREIAEKLNKIFGTSRTRNAILGKQHRLKQRNQGDER